MSQGRITRARMRYPNAQRRAAVYSRSRYGARLRTLPPHVLPGVTGRTKKTSRKLPVALVAIGLMIAGLTVFTTLTMAATTAIGARMTVDEYHAVTGTLPDAGAIFADTPQTSRIYDRDGNILQEVDDPEGYWRTFVSYDQVSPDLVNATIAAEDATFWTHQGVEPMAIVRGAFIIFTGAGSSGGSTITQQLARAIFDQIGNDYSIARKVREAFAAYDLTQKYSKIDILTMYLNQIFYGQRSYGIEAASVMYFDKHASELDLAESSLLAGIPQLPTAYNPVLYFDLAKQRQRYVLDQMVKLGYITSAEGDAAWNETLNIRGDRNGRVRDNPHFTQYVREFVTERYGADALYRGGLQIYTSIDSELQTEAEEIVRARVQEASPYSLNNGSAVIAHPQTGEILAMVGSADYDDPLIVGQVNVTTSARQPGSTMKPIAYLAAFEQMHWNPGTILLDVPFERETPSGTYAPGNFTGSFYGALTVRDALSNSLNIPALKAADNVGPEGVIEMARRLGMTGSFDGTPEEALNTGLQVALGGEAIRLVDLTNAYATIANEGRYVEFNPITRIEDAQGNVLYQLDPDETLRNAPQVVRAEYAYQITDILSDNEARQMLFGQGNIAETTQQQLGRQMATKSGTTNDVRDQLRMGYTTSAVVGTWTGNTDNSPMQPTPGNIGVDAMWSDLMLLIHQDRYRDLLDDGNGNAFPNDFPRPAGIYEGQVCANTSHSSGPGDSTRTVLLAEGNEPVVLCNQMTAWEQRDLDEALEHLNDPRLVGGAANSVRNYASELTGGAVRSGQTINPTSSGGNDTSAPSNAATGTNPTNGTNGTNPDGGTETGNGTDDRVPRPTIVPASG